MFAQRGFYGTSIASIAQELGLTKQALIHYFGTKEQLYGEVLKQMAIDLAGTVEKSSESSDSPAEQLEALFVRIYEGTVRRPDDNLLLMRELMDNPVRANDAQKWYLTEYLRSIVTLFQAAAGEAKLDEPIALARIYSIFGAINYFAVSKLTLRRMFGEDIFNALEAHYTVEVRRLVRAAVSGT